MRTTQEHHSPSPSLSSSASEASSSPSGSLSRSGTPGTASDDGDVETTAFTGSVIDNPAPSADCDDWNESDDAFEEVTTRTSESVLWFLLLEAANALGLPPPPAPPTTGVIVQNHILTLEWETEDGHFGSMDLEIHYDEVGTRYYDVGTGPKCEVKLPENDGADVVFGEIASSDEYVCGFPTTTIEMDWNPDVAAELDDLPGYNGPKRITSDDKIVEITSPCVRMTLLAKAVYLESVSRTRFRVLSNGVDIFTGWRCIDRLGKQVLVIEPALVRDPETRAAKRYSKVVKYTTGYLHGTRFGEEYHVHQLLKANHSGEVNVSILLDQGVVERNFYCLFDYLPGELLEEASAHEDYSDYSLLRKTIVEMTRAGEFCQRSGIFVPDVTAASFRYRGRNVRTDPLVLTAFGNSRAVGGLIVEDPSTIQFAEETKPPEVTPDSRDLNYQTAMVFSFGMVWLGLLSRDSAEDGETEGKNDAEDPSVGEKEAKVENEDIEAPAVVESEDGKGEKGENVGEEGQCAEHEACAEGETGDEGKVQGEASASEPVAESEVIPTPSPDTTTSPQPTDVSAGSVHPSVPSTTVPSDADAVDGEPANPEPTGSEGVSASNIDAAVGRVHGFEDKRSEKPQLKHFFEGVLAEAPRFRSRDMRQVLLHSLINTATNDENAEVGEEGAGASDEEEDDDDDDDDSSPPASKRSRTD